MAARKKTTKRARTKAPAEDRISELKSKQPNVGEILKRLRSHRGLSVRDVADACGISQSFLSMVERGVSDISLGRLTKLAEFFEHDIGSLLGYSTRISKPRFIKQSERSTINRGPGTNYENIRFPGLDFEVNVMKFNPHKGFKDSISHEGVDVMLVTSGEVVFCIGDDEYIMKEGDCVYHSAAYPHKIVNRSADSAIVLGITTGRMS